MATVFYSWQSDLPNATNRGFIEKALQKAVGAIARDPAIDVEPAVDRDTAGVPGSPDIVATILDKIANAAVFVCDVSIVGCTGSGRHTPNPNVLVELGYALHALGSDRILLVVNTAYGRTSDLPFDLRVKRAITYEAYEAESDRADERSRLSRVLETALRAILQQRDATKEGAALRSVTNAIETDRADCDSTVEEYFADLSRRLASIAPPAGSSDDGLVSALADSTALVAEFGSVAALAVRFQSSGALRSLYEGLASLRAHCEPTRLSVLSAQAQFDFYRFLLHELLVVLVARVLHKGWYTLVRTTLQGGVRAETALGAEMLSFPDLRLNVELLEARRQRLNSNATSLHADLLRERHMGPLSRTATFEEFQEAEYFLFLLAELPPAENPKDKLGFGWRAVTLVYGRDFMPEFLVKARSAAVAHLLAEAFSLHNVQALKSRFKERSGNLAERYGARVYLPPLRIDADSFGTVE